MLNQEFCFHSTDSRGKVFLNNLTDHLSYLTIKDKYTLTFLDLRSYNVLFCFTLHETLVSIGHGSTRCYLVPVIESRLAKYANVC